jgi:lysophospholipase L1-like esterase
MTDRIARAWACLLTAAAAAWICSAAAAAQTPAPIRESDYTETIRVACVGDSITYGYKVPEREKNAWPGQLAAMLGEKWHVANFGVGGATLLRKGNKPYHTLRAYKQALAFKPHVVIIKLGTNDSKAMNRPHFKDFVADYKAMIADFQALDTKPRIYLCYPMPAFADGERISGKVIKQQIIPMIDTVAKETHLPVIDVHTPLAGKPQVAPDKVHPNAAGSTIIAREIYKTLTGRDAAVAAPAEQALAGLAPRSTPAPSETSPAKPQEELPVFVLAGQSNMQGLGRTYELPGPLRLADPKVLIFDNNARTWKPYQPHPKGFGPELMFGREMAKAMGKPIGMIKYSGSGSDLFMTWNPAGPKENLYYKLVALVQQAKKTRPIRIMGMCWMQGERDSRGERLAVKYAENLDRLVTRSRADFGAEAMPFVLGRVNPPESYGAREIVRKAQAAIALPGTAWIDCDALPMHPDKLHYNTAGQLKLGRLFAEKMCALLKIDAPTTAPAPK